MRCRARCAGARARIFRFQGLKTAVRQIAREQQANTNDLAASFQAAVIDILCDRTRAAMAMFKSDFPDAIDPAFVLAGGVASNQAIRDGLTVLGNREGFQTKIPPPGLCTDNAAMVAWAGVEHGQLGLFDGLGTAPRARWPLDAHDRGGGGGRNQNG